MSELFYTFLILVLFVNIVIPALIVWLFIKYVFYLRKRQNDEFLDNLGYVVRDAVRDALEERDIGKRYEKTIKNAYTPKK